MKKSTKYKQKLYVWSATSTHILSFSLLLEGSWTVPHENPHHSAILSSELSGSHTAHKVTRNVVATTPQEPPTPKRIFIDSHYSILPTLIIPMTPKHLHMSVPSGFSSALKTPKTNHMCSSTPSPSLLKKIMAFWRGKETGPFYAL